MTSAELLARQDEAFERTGELDWSIVAPDFEVHDHELPDSAVHHGREGWRRWVSDWREAFEDYSLDPGAGRGRRSQDPSRPPLRPDQRRGSSAPTPCYGRSAANGS